MEHFHVGIALLGFSPRVPYLVFADTWTCCWCVRAGVGSAADGEAQMGDEEVHWVGISGWKRISLNRKPAAHLVGHVFRRGCIVFEYPDVSGVDWRRCNQHDDGISPVHPRTGVG